MNEYSYKRKICDFSYFGSSKFSEWFKFEWRFVAFCSICLVFVCSVKCYGVTYTTDFVEHEVDGQSVTFHFEPSRLATNTLYEREWDSNAAGGLDFGHYNINVKYDWDYDSNPYGNWEHIDNASTYDKQFTVVAYNGYTDLTVYLSPDYSVYYYWVYVYDGATPVNTYQDYGIILNNRSSFIIENEEPTPVRIAEIGDSENSVSIVSSVPVSIDASVSIGNTMTVDVDSYPSVIDWWFLIIIVSLGVFVGYVLVGRC